jgi:hypothetical protein
MMTVGSRSTTLTFTSSMARNDHQHGERCGHETVQHDDHVDYVHGAHRYASHGEHYDEH